ncbi:MAG: GAF domain-containing protein [Cytophagia bacterium]|nr:MAG: GAF domain-containing protein [Cytophagia bacterium]TAG43691.1 MAG: GAF domain-containing protein [Cytophagia bacterium]TAH30112.1 MAG: GAF domain-containing protein [Cytophagales bacterium]
MKLSYRVIGYIAVFLYIIGIFAVGVNALMYADAIAKLWKEMPSLFYLSTATNLLGLLAFIGLLLGVTTKTELVYVTNTKENQKINEDTESKQVVTENLQNKKTIDRIKQLLTDTNQNHTQMIEKSLRLVCEDLQASIGVIYQNQNKILKMVGSYALYQEKTSVTAYNIGEGLVGQVAKNKKTIKLNQIPEDYLPIVSGLGKALPSFVLILPILQNENEVLGVIELAGFLDFSDADILFLEDVALLLANELKKDLISG